MSKSTPLSTPSAPPPNSTSETNSPNKDSDPFKDLPISTGIFLSEISALATPGVMMKKDAVAVRSFGMADGKSLTAFTFLETNDSFVVGLPTVMLGLIKEGKEYTLVKFVSPLCILRFFKSSIITVGIPPPRHLFYYLVNARDNFDKIPGYFDDGRKIQINQLIEAMELEFGFKPKNLIKTDMSEVMEATGATSAGDTLQKQKHSFEQMLENVTDSSSRRNSGSSIEVDFDKLSWTNPSKTRYKH